ncbi:unnamed protein product [marine sediment metagenome]|uniref:Uncharacterized protein n=1 Tax=marine sediment metagenome TaxID=412755 RepID=X1F8F9_9ZZZZ
MTAQERVRSKKLISKLYKKHYNKGDKQAKTSTPQPSCDTNKAGVGIVEQPSLGNTGEKAGSQADEQAQKDICGTPTRADLMYAARKDGLKYYRILSKEELIEALYNNQNNLPGNDEIINKAKARWKGGWGSKKGAQ